MFSFKIRDKTEAITLVDHLFYLDLETYWLVKEDCVHNPFYKSVLSSRSDAFTM